jgi:hypothetical protein
VKSFVQLEKLETTAIILSSSSAAAAVTAFTEQTL